MNKAAIRNFAIWAQQQLAEAVRRRAREYGIVQSGVSAATKPLTEEEHRQRQQLLEEIHRKGYEPVMEEGAYLWFHRFVTLRCLEVNGLVPSGLRVLTDETGTFPPKMQTVTENPQTAYRHLLISRCNALHRDLPQLFGEIHPWAQLLCPDGLLQPDSVPGNMIAQIGEADFQEVETVGWLYQFYFSGKREAVIDPLRGTAIQKEDIPAATQVFTTDWVVRYILDNSLGRYWLERNPDSLLADQLTFLVKPVNGRIEPVNEPVEPQSLKVLDPCVGSGHFLSYAFDLLMQIYRERGWSDRDAAKSILEHNLYGLDIDERAVQLACFAVTVKAGKYHPDLLTGGLQLPILAMEDSDGIRDEVLCCAARGNGALHRKLQQLRSLFRNAGEYGSILSVPGEDFRGLYEQLCNHPAGADRRLLHMVRQAEILGGEYDIVATNPPYLNRYSPGLKEYILRHFGDYKGDLFSVFMFRSFGLCKEKGYCGFMTPMVWMFLKTYEPLRRYLLSQKFLTTLIQLEYSAFEDATVPVCAFVLKNAVSGDRALCFRLSDFPGGMELQKQKVLEALANPNCGYFYEADQSDFGKIPTVPIAYWLSPKFLSTFANKTLDQIAKPRQGLATGCNDLFVRRWYEVSECKVCYDARSAADALESGKKWFPYNKGGQFRKWYGNQEYLVNWEKDGALIRHFKNPEGKLRSRPQNTKYYFRRSITWSLISSGTVAFRYQPEGHIFDVAGMSCFAKEHLLYLLGLCNSTVALEVLAVLAPTINFQAGDIANIPVVIDRTRLPQVEALVKQNIAISKADWDAFETSWGFERHPLLGEPGAAESRIAEQYSRWEAQCHDRFCRLKANEEKLNRIFIEIYGLQDELSPRVEDKAVTVRRADLQREIKSLISYAVGCVFGRYSHHTDGLLYAGGDWETALTRLPTIDGKGQFLPDEHNMVPIGDGESHGDDLANRIFAWVEAVYGRQTLEENLQFIAAGLGGKGTSREVIGNYLRTGFYADHCKIYRNRPVYWLFTSGKKNGFQALIYMHRYQPDLPERMCQAVQAQQEQNGIRLRALERAAARAGAAEKVQLKKKIEKLKGQAVELEQFEEKLRRFAEQRIAIDLDDGVKVNYEKFRGLVR